MKRRILLAAITGIAARAAFPRLAIGRPGKSASSKLNIAFSGSGGERPPARDRLHQEETLCGFRFRRTRPRTATCAWPSTASTQETAPMPPCVWMDSGSVPRSGRYPTPRSLSSTPPANPSSNFTYFFPVTPPMHGRSLEVVALGLAGCDPALKPEVWTTTYPHPYESLEIVLE